MQYLNEYLQKIKDRGNDTLADSVLKTADDVSEKAINKFSFATNDIGLLLGNVQSGKTGQVFGVICRATDMGFPVFVLLTTDNVVLQQQTLVGMQKRASLAKFSRRATCWFRLPVLPWESTDADTAGEIGKH